MSIAKVDILNSISEMSVMDVCDLVKMMEEKFGVSAQAAVAVAPQGDGAASEAVVKTEFDVVLVGAGANKISAIKAVRAATGLGLKEAKSAVESVPFTIKEGLAKGDAEELQKQLTEAGAQVELK